VLDCVFLSRLTLVLLSHAICVFLESIYLLFEVLNLVCSAELGIFLFCFLFEVCECDFKLSMEVVGIGFELCDVETSSLASFSRSARTYTMVRSRSRLGQWNKHL
jgi:hypothetical protein